MLLDSVLRKVTSIPHWQTWASFLSFLNVTLLKYIVISFKTAKEALFEVRILPLIRNSGPHAHPFLQINQAAFGIQQLQTFITLAMGYKHMKPSIYLSCIILFENWLQCTWTFYCFLNFLFFIPNVCKWGWKKASLPMLINPKE